MHTLHMVDFLFILGTIIHLANFPLTRKSRRQSTRTPKGFGLQPGAVSRYYITADYPSTCLKQLRSMSELDITNRSHVDLTGSFIRRDDKAVKSLVELIETN